jgi:hypothetical protein
VPLERGKANAWTGIRAPHFEPNPWLVCHGLKAGTQTTLFRSVDASACTGAGPPCDRAECKRSSTGSRPIWARETIDSGLEKGHGARTCFPHESTSVRAFVSAHEIMSATYQAAWVARQTAPPADSAGLDEYNAFYSLDSGLGHPDTVGALQAPFTSGTTSSATTLAPSSGPGGDGMSGVGTDNSWWGMPSAGVATGPDAMIDPAASGWMSGTESMSGNEYDSDSTIGTSSTGHCTSPEAEVAWLPSSTDVAQPRSDPYSDVELQLVSTGGLYPRQSSVPQITREMPVPDFIRQGYRIKQEQTQHHQQQQMAAAPRTYPRVKQESAASSIVPPLQGASTVPYSAPAVAKPPTRKRQSSAPAARSSEVKEGKGGKKPAAADTGPSSPKRLDTDGTTCPVCNATFAGGEAGAVPHQPQDESGAASKTKKKKKKSASEAAAAAAAGDEVRQRCFRNRKDARRHNRQGKWWSSVGYSGEPYCQRCSEIFRDHIIRTMSNSANCTRDHPCHDCEQILSCFSDGREAAYKKMEDRRSKTAPGHNGPYKRRKRGQRPGGR